MKFCIEFDPNHPDQLPSVSGGRPDQSLPGHQPGAGQLPSHGGGGRPDNSLPGSQPGAGQLPSHGGWHRPDNALPGVDKPVDPEYGTDPKPPGSPDQGLPMPHPHKPFTDEEKTEILRLAEQKFTHTELSPMRAIVQAARWVLVTRKKDSGAQPGTPDQGLPTPPPTGGQLPGAPTPPTGGQLPAGPQPQPTPPIAPGGPTTPDNSLPPAPGQLPGTQPQPSPKSTY